MLILGIPKTVLLPQILDAYPQAWKGYNVN